MTAALTAPPVEDTAVLELPAGPRPVPLVEPVWDAVLAELGDPGIRPEAERVPEPFVLPA